MEVCIERLVVYDDNADLSCKNMALFSYRKGNVIEEQMKSLGSSFDWRRNFFTLDEVIAVCKLHELSRLQQM